MGIGPGQPSEVVMILPCGIPERKYRDAPAEFVPVKGEPANIC